VEFGRRRNGEAISRLQRNDFPPSPPQLKTDFPKIVIFGTACQVLANFFERENQNKLRSWEAKLLAS
jgi:hypothetical protein